MVFFNGTYCSTPCFISNTVQQIKAPNLMDVTPEIWKLKSKISSCENNIAQMDYIVIRYCVRIFEEKQMLLLTAS